MIFPRCSDFLMDDALSKHVPMTVTLGTSSMGITRGTKLSTFHTLGSSVIFASSCSEGEKPLKNRTPPTEYGFICILRRDACVDYRRCSLLVQILQNTSLTMDAELHLDNLLTGHMENINHRLNHESFNFIQGDIRDYETCRQAVKRCTHVSHQALWGQSRSIDDPLLSLHQHSPEVNECLFADQRGRR